VSIIHAAEVITPCDHLGFLLGGEPKHEIFGKTVSIAFYGLVQGSCLDSIEFSEIGIDHHRVAANGQNRGFQGFRPLHEITLQNTLGSGGTLGPLARQLKV